MTSIIMTKIFSSIIFPQLFLSLIDEKFLFLQFIRQLPVFDKLEALHENMLMGRKGNKSIWYNRMP